MLISDKSRYVRVAFDNEAEIEDVVLDNAGLLFGPHAIILKQARITTVGGRATVPDGIAIDLQEEEWYLIEAERACCSGVAFEQVPSAAPDRLRLEIRGVDPDAPIFGALSAGVLPDGPTSPGRRFAVATGIGVLGSVFVCCVLPIGAGALLGSSAAAFSFFDAPVPIGIGALLGGGATWWWLGRNAK